MTHIFSSIVLRPVQRVMQRTGRSDLRRSRLSRAVRGGLALTTLLVLVIAGATQTKATQSAYTAKGNADSTAAITAVPEYVFNGGSGIRARNESNGIAINPSTNMVSRVK